MVRNRASKKQKSVGIAVKNRLESQWESQCLYRSEESVGIIVGISEESINPICIVAEIWREKTG